MSNELVPAGVAVAFDLAPLPADRNPTNVYLARLGLGSRRTMRGALDAIAGLISGGKTDAEGFPWHALRYEHTAAIRAALAARYRPATANKVIASLRGVLKEAFRLGLMPAEDFTRASDIAIIKAQTLPRGRALAAGEISALLSCCARDRGLAGRRDAALIAVTYGAGLRRSEAVALDVADFNSDSGELVIRGAKGRKDRISYATNGAGEALADWIEVRGSEPGPLFCHIGKGGRIVIRRLSDQAVLYILAVRAGEAGVSRFSPHDLRRTFISDLLDAGADISMAQHLAGHSNVSTTARYDRRGEVAKRKAAALLHVPYFRRK